MVNFSKIEFQSKNKHLSNKEVRLFEACYQNDIKSAKQLLAGGLFSKPVSVNLYAHYSPSTPLIAALEFSDDAMVKLLISYGANVNEYNDDEYNDSPLVYAIKYKTMEIVRLLITHGAYVNSRTRWGETPLKAAIKEGNKEIVELLILSGAYFDNENLWDVILDKRKDIAEFFISLGIDVNEDSSGHGSFLHGIIDLCLYGSDREIIEIFELLVDSGADVNVKNRYGDTPLDLAIHNGNNELAKILISKGAYYNADCHNGLHLFSKWISCDNTKHMRYCLVCYFKEENSHKKKSSLCVDYPYCNDDCSENYYCEICNYRSS